MTYPEAGKAWDFLGNATDDEIPLLWASLVVAQDEYPSLDVTAYEAQLAAYGTRVRAAAEAKDEDMVGAVRALNRVLFDELGFSGNQQDYYDPRNSYLNDVVERKLGIPISLAVIQLDLARRVGLPMHGVSFPGHFLVGMPMDGGLLVLDPYHRGRSVDAAELKQRAKPHVGDQDLKDEQLSDLLTPASNRAILGRMLRNLKALYAEKEDWERALRCTDRILTLEPEAPAELRDRGLLYLRVGHYKAAREDLSKFLATKPPEKDAESVREVLIKTSAERARLN
jgi:regulator of sirC expression with transglutaminase-like and TPR domain